MTTIPRHLEQMLATWYIMSARAHQHKIPKQMVARILDPKDVQRKPLP